MVVYREVTGAPSSKPAKICKVMCALCSQSCKTQYGCYQHCVKYHRQTDNANETTDDSNSDPELNAADEEHQDQLADEVEAEHLRQVEAEAEEERQRILAAELEADYQRKIADAAKHRQIAEQKRLAEEAEQQRIAAEEAEQQRQLAEIDAEYQQKMSIRQHIITVETERKRAEEIAIQTQNAVAKAEQEKNALRNRLTVIAAEREELSEIILVERRKTYNWALMTDEQKIQVNGKRQAILNRKSELDNEATRLQDELNYDQKEITRRKLEQMTAQQQLVQNTHKMFFGQKTQYI